LISEFVDSVVEATIRHVESYIAESRAVHRISIPRRRKINISV